MSNPITRRNLIAAGAAGAAGAFSAREAAGAAAPAAMRHFIWTGEAGLRPNHFVGFRHRIEIQGESAAALLHIFADTRYIAFLNGSYLASGPARFDPRFPEYDTLSVRLKRGRNLLAVLVHSLGRSNAWSIAHSPGLTYVLEGTDEAGKTLHITSGEDTRWSAMEAWDPQAPVGWPSALEWFDARRFPPGWNDVEFDDSRWRPAAAIVNPSWGPFQPRSIPLLRERDLNSAAIIAVDTDEGRTPNWIWHEEGLPEPETIDRAAASGPRLFRWRFEAADSSAAELRLMAGGDYALYLNGRLVERRNVLTEPARGTRFLPSERLSNAANRVWRHDLRRFLQPGENVLALEVRHHLYEASPRRSAAGVLAQINLQEGQTVRSLVSDAAWVSSSQPREGWEQLSFDASGWQPVRVLGAYGIEPWGLAPGSEAFRVSRLLPVVPRFPFELAQRERAVLDFGNTTLARPVLRLEGSADAQLEMSYADDLDRNGQPAVSFGPDRYISTNGAQTWATTDVRGFRYLVITADRGSIRLLSAAATERLYPVELLGKFSSSDPLLTSLWPRCAETLHLCMEDAYIDTPVRERAQWFADAMACGFHVNLVAFGDTALYRRMLRQIGESQDEIGADIASGGGMMTTSEGLRWARQRLGTGWVWARYPSQQLDIHSNIEDYMLLWVIGHRDYYEQTLDLPFLRAQWPRITRLLEWFHSHRTPRGLVRAREFVYFGNPVAYLTGEGATLNIFYLLALRAAAEMAYRLAEVGGASRYSKRAEDMSTAIRSSLRQPGGDLFLAMLDGNKIYPPSVHANVLALLAGLVPADREKPVLDWIESNLAKEVISPYMYYWVFEMLYGLRDAERAERLVLEQVRTKWGPLADLATMRESFSRGAPTHIAGTVPAWVASAGVLGVRVVERDGVRQIRIRPRLGDLESAEGAVPTTLGLVEVKHRRTAGALRTEVSVPDGAPAWLGLQAGISPTNWIRLPAGRHVVEGRS